MRNDYGHNLLRGLPRVVAVLVHLVGVLPQQRSPFLLVEELVAGLAQEHEPFWTQVLVVRGILMVHIEILHTRVVLSTEFTGLVPCRQHILAEY